MKSAGDEANRCISVQVNESPVSLTKQGTTPSKSAYTKEAALKVL
jgi:hypothetical protein